MEKYDGSSTTAVECDEHDFMVHFCEEYPYENSYFLGYCLRCGTTTELSIKQIEEAFNG